MDLFEVFLIFVAFGIGACVQRFFHILEESGVATADPIKSWSKSMSLQSKAASPKGSKRVKGVDSSDKVQQPSKKTPSSKSSKSSSKDQYTTPTSTSTLTSGISTSTDSTASTSATTGSTMTTTATGSDATQQTTPPPMEPTQQISAPTTTTSPVTIPSASTKTAQSPATSSLNSFSEIPVSPMAEPANGAVVPTVPKRIRPATLCDCGLELINERERYNDDTSMPDFDQPVIFANKILIYPISYEHYRAVTLVHPPTGQTVLSPFVTKRPFVQETVNILTPFKPLLHSLYYAHRHVTMIEDLLTNYQYLED